MKKLIIFILLLSSTLYAADTKVTALDELTAILGTDILYVIDDPGGTPLSKKITATNLFDLIDTFSELNTIVADKTLVNEEDAVAWDALGTFNLGITITTGDPLTLGTNRWDNGSDLIDGEMIAADTIDNDSIDWGDMTDLTTDGAVVWGNLAAGELTDDSVNDDDINWGDLTYLTTNGAGINEAYASGWNADVGPPEKDDVYDYLHNFDADDDGSFTDETWYTNIIDGTTAFTDFNGVDIIDSDNYAADSIDNEHINWGDIDNLGDEGAITVADTTDSTSFVALWESATGDLAAKSDGALLYAADTGTLAATQFSGGGAGLTAIDAATGDNASSFFDAGTIEHEYGGLEADISGYTGLVAITGGSTAEVDAKSELEGHIADVADFAEADGDIYTGVHDFGGATSIEIVNAEDPDVDANGEMSQDTDGANEAGDVSIRGFDGSAQFLIARKLKTLNFTLISPDTIDAADLIPVWHNTSGMTFTIVEWKAWSDDDNVSLELEELTDQTNYTAITTIDAVEIATDGTGVYYASDATITHAAIEHDHSIAIDFDTTDTPDYVQIAITGWFNSDVD